MSCWRPAICLCVFLASFGLSRGGTLAQFRTVFGDIEVELYDKDKPVTVANFIKYVQSGRYTNEFAHRLVPGFVVQGGGFTMTNRDTPNPAILSVPTYAPITNEFKVGHRFSNTNGTIAMAKTSDPNSATSEFFINLANNSASLDDTNNSGGFTVFGHTIRGTNVLNILNAFQYWTGTQTTNLVYNWGAPFDTLPLLHPSLADTNFLFMDVTLLQVAIRPAIGGGREISWNSAGGMTNIVEFTTNMPPLWNTLIATNGIGNRMGVVDKSAATKRFYRVRVAN
jgi:cyclophilin family peptidyl-prolyl cis-trans isomerase